MAKAITPDVSNDRPGYNKPATSAAAEPFEMEERKEPTFVKFEVGDVIEGILITITKITIADQNTGAKKPAIRYTLLDPDSGEMFCFLGSYQIDTKVRPSDCGHRLRVIYEGKDDSVSRNGNAMNKYSVFVSRKPAINVGQKMVDGSFITDDDIPF